MKTVHPRLAIAVTALALLVAAAPGVTSPAGAAIDPSASAFLAGALKPAMQKTLKKEVPGLVVTTVKCFVPTTSKLITGNCTAKFKLAKYNLIGVYQAKATLDNKSRLSWSTTSRSCSDSRTRQRASCTGETSTGGGLISARDAEAQLLARGFVFKTKNEKAKTAVCRGIKSKKWKRGEFDDVFKQLNCKVTATDKASYKIVFVMVNAQTYRLKSVVKG